MATIADTAYEANRSFSIGDTDYVPGDPVDVMGMADHKIGQLLNQRFIRPARARDGEDVGVEDGLGGPSAP